MAPTSSPASVSRWASSSGGRVMSTYSLIHDSGTRMVRSSPQVRDRLGSPGNQLPGYGSLRDRQVPSGDYQSCALARLWRESPLSQRPGVAIGRGDGGEGNLRTAPG